MSFESFCYTYSFNKYLLNTSFMLDIIPVTWIHRWIKQTKISALPGLGRFPGIGNGNPLQYSCLKNSMDRRAWWPIVHAVARIGHDWAYACMRMCAHTHTHKLTWIIWYAIKLMYHSNKWKPWVLSNYIQHEALYSLEQLNTYMGTCRHTLFRIIHTCKIIQKWKQQNDKRFTMKTRLKWVVTLGWIKQEVGWWGKTTCLDVVYFRSYE